MLHPNAKSSCVRYYYLAARNGNSAEVIKVVNGQSYTIHVPLWEEDVVLEPIFSRPMTCKEESSCKGIEVWKLFNDWDKLYKDLKKGAEENDLKKLEANVSGLLVAEDTSLA